MKKILLLILLLINFSIYSQVKYPCYQIDSLGQTIVLLTIEQAQSLDSDLDLLVLFEQLNNQIINYDSVTVNIINQQEKIILEQTILIDMLKKQSLNKDEIIKNLQLTILTNEKMVNNLDEQVTNLQEQVLISKKEIKKTKTKMVIGGIISGLINISLLYLILFQ